MAEEVDMGKNRCSDTESGPSTVDDVAIRAVSADAQIGFLRDLIAEATAQRQEARNKHDLCEAGECTFVIENFAAILRTVNAARAVYKNRADGDPIWISDLFQAVAPVAVPGTDARTSGTTSKTDESKTSGTSDE